MKNISVWEQLTALPFLNLYERLISSAMELDVFSHLTEPVTARALAEKMGWHVKNTEYLLSALVSVGFVDKKRDCYENTSEANRYLVKGTKEYLGDFLLFYSQNEGNAPMDVKKLVEKGPGTTKQMEQSLDFEQYGNALRNAQRGYRQEELLKIVRSLPENEAIHHILDLGCAAGLLGLSVIADKKDRSGVLFDLIMPDLIEQSVKDAGLEGRAAVKIGDFMTDELGSGYDLILAIGVMLFAKGNMEQLLKKCCLALNPGGVLLVVGEGISPDHTGPWDMVLGYLPYYFQGMDLGVLKNEIEDAAKASGFTKFERHTELLCSGTQDICIIRK